MIEVTDTFEAYYRFISGEILPSEYIDSDNIFFEHYFRFWSSVNSSIEKMSAEEFDLKMSLAASSIKNAEERLISAGINCVSSILLTAACGTANGHAMKYGGGFTAWAAIECFGSKLQFDVFITHEIIHALNYRKAPELYFTDHNEKNNMLRQIITEGIASYVTMKLLDLDRATALWADYLNHEELSDWMNKCRNAEDELLSTVRSCIKDEDKQSGDLFSFTNSGNIMLNRGGYYAGLMVTEMAADFSGLSPADIISLNKADFTEIMRRIV